MCGVLGGLAADELVEILFGAIAVVDAHVGLVRSGEDVDSGEALHLRRQECECAEVNTKCQEVERNKYIEAVREVGLRVGGEVHLCHDERGVVRLCLSDLCSEGE